MIYTHVAAAILGAAIAATGAWKVQEVRISKMKIERAEAVAESERFGRGRERELNAINRKVTNDYIAEKTRSAAATAAAADALRLFDQANSATEPGADPAAASGVAGPYPAIAGECARELFALDGYAQSVASKARALQDYAREVCVSK